MPLHEHVRELRAMGSDCRVRVVVDEADDGLGPVMLDDAVALLAELEDRWSRFRDHSELSALNAHAGAPVFTSAETATIVAMAVQAWSDTGGLFDPTVHDALVAAGYDRSFDALGAEGARPDVDAARRTTVPGPAGIEVDERVGLVQLPPGCRIDLGGIGKGRAADLVLDRLLLTGAVGACVDLGGDVRVGGRTAGGSDDWLIAVDDPFRPGRDLAALRLASGAVTTSSRTRRRWVGAGGEGHHLIDPRTGRPAASGLASVTVVAGTAAAAEVHAKAALVGGLDHGRRLLEQAGMCALLVGDDGTVHRAGPIEPFLVPVPSPAHPAPSPAWSHAARPAGAEP